MGSPLLSKLHFCSKILLNWGKDLDGNFRGKLKFFWHSKISFQSIKNFNFLLNISTIYFSLFTCLRTTSFLLIFSFIKWYLIFICLLISRKIGFSLFFFSITIISNNLINQISWQTQDANATYFALHDDRLTISYFFEPPVKVEFLIKKKTICALSIINKLHRIIFTVTN